MAWKEKPLLLVGDVFFTESDVAKLFQTVRHDLKDFVVLANLEGSLELDGSAGRKKAVRLGLAGFDKSALPDNLIFSLVNNHVTDFGLKNFYHNLEFLGDSAVISTRRSPVCQIEGDRIIFLADTKEQCVVKGTDFVPFNNAAVSQLGKAFSGAIAVVHGGIEHRKYPTNYQRNIARRIAEYGAKAVIFHHSHRIGHSEYWNGALIHYGLGNAFFSDLEGLHCLQDSVSEGVLFEDKITILKLAQLKPLGCQAVASQNIDKLNSNQYRALYKKTYALDASLRPRQLGLSDFYTSVQYCAWSLFANSFVRLGLSRKIKQIIRTCLRPKLTLESKRDQLD